MDWDKQRRNEIICPIEKDVKNVTNKVRVSGLWSSVDPEITVEKHYSEKLTQVNQSLDRWEYQRLSLIGKIMIKKYILSTIPTNHRFVQEISNLFLKFLRNGGGGEGGGGQNQTRCDP